MPQSSSPLRVLDIDREIEQQGIPTSAQATYRKALAGSRPSAVKAMRLFCMGWEDGARKMVRECQSVGCPLHAVRPYQVKGIVSEEAENDIEDADVEGAEEDETMISQPSPSIADPSKRILSVLSTSTLQSKSEILQRSKLDPSLWTPTINTLLFMGKVERIGERKSARYRRIGDDE